MAIITISRGSFTQAETIAREVARKLGYELVIGDAVLVYSNGLNISEADLIGEVQNLLSVIDALEVGNGTYVPEIRDFLLNFLLKDDVVYCGVAGQAFLQGVPHALNVRIVADPDELARITMEKDAFSWEKAMKIVAEDDEERRRWCRELYGIDIWESKYYDMVLKTGALTIDATVETIISFIQRGSFQKTGKFLERLRQLAEKKANE